MIFYAGADLTREIESRKEKAMLQTGLNHVYERDFVSDVRENYFETDDYDKVLVISGLRGTGKTFGLLQAIENMEDSVYICVQKEESETSEDYIQFLKQRPEKNIIIDEYNWITDREKLDYFLWTLVEDGKRVAIAGADFMTMDYLNYGALLYKIAYVNVSIFHYDEFCRVYQKESCKESFEEYLRTGGLFKEDVIDSFSALVSYIETAVVNHLTSKARTIVYDIMYLAICGTDMTSQLPTTYRSGVLQSSSDENFIRKGKWKKEEAYQRMLAHAGVNPDVSYSPSDFTKIIEILEKTRFLRRTYRLGSDKEYRIHLTNPSLTYQMALEVFQLTSGVFSENVVEECLEKAFEAYATIFVFLNTKTWDYLWYDDLGKKFGKPGFVLIVVDADEHRVYLFETELQETPVLSENSSLVSREMEELFTGADIAGRYVICNTKQEQCAVVNHRKVIFTQLDSHTIEEFSHFNDTFKCLKRKAKAH